MTAISGITIKGNTSTITVGFIDNKNSGIQVTEIFNEDSKTVKRTTYKIHYNGNVSVSVCSPKCTSLAEAKVFPMEQRVKAEKLCYSAAEQAFNLAQEEAKKIKALIENSANNSSYDPKQALLNLMKYTLETEMVLDICDLLYKVREIHTSKPQSSSKIEI